MATSDADLLSAASSGVLEMLPRCFNKQGTNTVIHFDRCHHDAVSCCAVTHERDIFKQDSPRTEAPPARTPSWNRGGESHIRVTGWNRTKLDRREVVSLPGIRKSVNLGPPAQSSKGHNEVVQCNTTDHE